MCTSRTHLYLFYSRIYELDSRKWKGKRTKTTFVVLKLQDIIFLDLTQALIQIMNKSAKESYQNTRGKFHCDSCNHVATRFESLKAHKLAKHEGLVYNCDKCDFKTAHKNSLERHKFKHGKKSSAVTNVTSKPLYLIS